MQDKKNCTQPGWSEKTDTARAETRLRSLPPPPPMVNNSIRGMLDCIFTWKTNIETIPQQQIPHAALECLFWFCIQFNVITHQGYGTSGIWAGFCPKGEKRKWRLLSQSWLIPLKQFGRAELYTAMFITTCITTPSFMIHISSDLSTMFSWTSDLAKLKKTNTSWLTHSWRVYADAHLLPFKSSTELL